MESCLFFSLLAGSVFYFIYKVYRRLCYIRLGRPACHADRPLDRLKYFAANVLGQKKIRRYTAFGLCHAFIMYGFIILLPGIPNMAAERLFSAGIPFIENSALYLFIKDLFIVLVMIGVTGCLLRRTIKKPEWLKNNFEAVAILLLIFTIVSTEALYYGTSLAMGLDAGTFWPAPLARALSGLFFYKQAAVKLAASSVFWWTHFLAIFSLCLIIPNSKHMHMLFAPFNVYWHSLEHRGAIKPAALDGTAGKKAGANKMEDFTWKQISEAYTCVKCGRCNDQCPAHQSGEPVKPKPLQGRFRKHVEERAPLLLKQKTGHYARQVASEQAQEILKKKIIGGVYKKDFIWGCAMCGGCEEACPVSIEHTPKIIAMRRHLVLAKNDYPDEIRDFFSSVELHGNPWGAARDERNSRLTNSGVNVITQNNAAEYLFFAGCAASYEPGAARAAAALSNIMKKAGVSFATLGADEWCCGETARRLGNEALFQQIAQSNIKKWNELGVRKIITSCAHCYNTLKNEYPQFGGNWEVIHHTVLLAGLLKEGRLKFNKNNNVTITYHDPCYLGRYNDIWREPREILRALPGVRLAEMQRSKNESFCCGAGGGRFWTKPVEENLVAANRMRQVSDTGASVLGTACPYCKLLLEDMAACQGTGESIQILDIAEIMEMAL